MDKIQLTLTNQETQLLSRQAARLGYDVTKYVKFLISREAYKAAVTKSSTRTLSTRAERHIQEALEEHEHGTTTPLALSPKKK